MSTSDCIREALITFNYVYFNYVYYNGVQVVHNGEPVIVLI